MKRLVCVWLAIVLGSLFISKLFASAISRRPGTGPGLPETVEAIDSARVTTRILYITAHPDDEEPGSSHLPLGCGLYSAHVALLSLTRGEGGQNALVPNKHHNLG